jgi:glutamyl/glutaminyl-tRNA synthetase
MPYYRAAFDQLRAGGWIYPCSCSRRDIRQALSAPHAADEDPLYPGTCRPATKRGLPDGSTAGPDVSSEQNQQGPSTRRTRPVSWRFRVPDGETVAFVDGYFGAQQFVAGRDFGDFVVWRPDDLPAYQLAVVVDDHAMRITEVVRGADLLLSTARQLVLYRALSWSSPAFWHCPLLTDNQGNRLAKRHDALSLRALRDQGRHPADLRAAWAITCP